MSGVSGAEPLLSARLARGPASEGELVELFAGAGLTLSDLSAALTAAGAVEADDPAGGSTWSLPA